MRGFKGNIASLSVSCASLAYGYSHLATAWLPSFPNLGCLQKNRRPKRGGGELRLTFPKSGVLFAMKQQKGKVLLLS